MSFDAIEYINSPKRNISKPGLERINLLCNLLGNPQNFLKFIHVAGTNGKGSVCAYLTQILINTGVRVGTFTSPFIWNFQERIKVNNKQIDKSFLNNITYKIKQIIDSLPPDCCPTEFEIMTAVGFMYFKQCCCDVVVLEVGMGGKLDSTNVIPESSVLCSVITKIGIDHVNFLSNNIVNIAKEKAGIIKDNVPVVVAPQKPSVLNIIKDEALVHNSDLHIVSEDDISIKKVNLNKIDNFNNNENINLIREFSYKNYKSLKTKLLGIYHPINASIAIEACEVLNKSEYFKGEFFIDKENIVDGVLQTIWPVRFEILSANPYIIIDGAHNVDGASALISSIRDVFGEIKPIFIFGILKDKEYKKIIEKISKYASYVFTITPKNVRALDASILESKFKNLNVKAKACSSFNEAVKSSLALANKTNNNLICSFGSLYTAGQIHDLFLKHLAK